MFTRDANIALLAAAAVVTTGCSRYRDPDFDVIAIRELERTQEALVLGFTLRARNPNDEALPLKQASYRLSLDGRTVFDGQRSAEAILRRFDDAQTIELPAVVPAADFDLARFDQPAPVPYRLTGTVEYQTPGELAEVLFDSGVRRPKAHISVGGELDTGG